MSENASPKKRCGEFLRFSGHLCCSLTILGVLGCTGSVGQRFILLLAAHPWFTLHAVGASARSAGKPYKDAVAWKQSKPIPKEFGELIVKECAAFEFSECDIIFSGLDAEVAGDIGEFYLLHKYDF
jgi:aspartate-semialdehyde dehydrogenase